MKLNIKVYPSSGKQKICKISEKEYKVFLRKPSRDNKANIELIKNLNKYFKKEVKILSGKTSKRKLVEVI